MWLEFCLCAFKILIITLWGAALQKKSWMGGLTRWQGLNIHVTLGLGAAATANNATANSLRESLL